MPTSMKDKQMDQVNDPAQDVCTPEGREWAEAMCWGVKPDGELWFGPPCGSFVMASAPSSPGT